MNEAETSTPQGPEDGAWRAQEELYDRITKTRNTHTELEL
jgi:hypothetical protein